ncbi:N-acetylmuramoyl-L-alanine amidase [Paenibacillus aquistagni]|uniref:N-acetylmuramoyl-L-alanine amidase n=1 Tax=Paenibacillus aquistagni TaxID=1852522 RepID=A0A1X7LHI9_9BACL|nr:N-acetylmuramoyl-L-alanine amidase [Paenibacillus aquistagni]NMM54999.1 N-acetylmuramoyl-L-alanine amidase [Paenibacillus aquistagni]SMG53140.1 N-acetylmuramoyl-L-alanine amidase [Paenibacillus aquistagni]
MYKWFIIRMLIMLTVAQAAAAWPVNAQAQPAAPQDKQPISHVFTQRFVLIDAGHGGIDGGTVHHGILEKDINLAIAQKLYLLLKSKGVPVILNRTGDYALSDDNRWSATRSRHRRDLAQRRQLSEELPISMFVSIHVNWAKSPSKRGPMVIHQAEGRSQALAFLIQQELETLAPSPHLPDTGSKYYLLRRVKQPAVIVETGFISNAKDRELLTSRRGQSLIAMRLCDAIIHYHTLYY